MCINPTLLLQQIDENFFFFFFFCGFEIVDCKSIVKCPYGVHFLSLFKREDRMKLTSLL
jgi:hypothetical protein